MTVQQDIFMAINGYNENILANILAPTNVYTKTVSLHLHTLYRQLETTVVAPETHSFSIVALLRAEFWRSTPSTYMHT